MDCWTADQSSWEETSLMTGLDAVQRSPSASLREQRIRDDVQMTSRLNVASSTVMSTSGLIS